MYTGKTVFSSSKGIEILFSSNILTDKFYDLKLFAVFSMHKEYLMTLCFNYIIMINNISAFSKALICS